MKSKIKEAINTFRIFQNELRETHGNSEQVIVLYEKFIERFIQLDEKYKFSASFKKGYIFDQLDILFKKKQDTLSFIPFGVKDIFNSKVLPTEMGSKIWKGYNAGNNARIVQEIVYRGGIIFCKTSTAEFAVHYIEDGLTLNPYRADRITGTSSAGSAVAVAVGALPICLATQTAGSIMRPSSFCGTFGFKPSFGALDRTGVLKTNDTLDTLGMIGCDLNLILDTFLKLYQNTKDYPFSKLYKQYYVKYLDKKPNILLIDDQYNGYNNYDNYVQNSFEQISRELSKKYNIVSVDNDELNCINQIHDSHEIIYDKSLSYYFLEESKQHDKISDVMTFMIKKGEKHSEADYLKQIKTQRELTAQFNKIIDDYEIDYIITPSTATCAPKLGLRERNDTSLIWTYLGLPAVSIPLFYNENLGLPYGLQIVAPRYHDIRLLKFSKTVFDDFCE
jgi:Asp-tRNA(Asn)/Glu-tRNA(Gln) amidotransferase A subunit family amidase